MIPCDHNYDDPAEQKHLSGSHAIYSDGQGRSWKLSAPIRPRVNEYQVELFDGRGTRLMNMRSNYGRNLRTHSTSTDGGMTWTTPADVPRSWSLSARRA